MNIEQLEASVPDAITIDPKALDVIDLPGLASKKQVADWCGVTTRHIDSEINAGRFPYPIYVGRRTPRWRRSDVLAWLEGLQSDDDDE